jgi:transcriptional regulator with XRE-family HTH domain
MNKHMGSTLSSFFDKVGEREEVLLQTQKKVLAAEVRERMRQLRINKAALARRMRTSRSHVDRLLDPDNTSVTLATLARASAALGLSLHIRLAPERPSPLSRRPRSEGATVSR